MFQYLHPAHRMANHLTWLILTLFTAVSPSWGQDTPTGPATADDAAQSSAETSPPPNSSILSNATMAEDETSDQVPPGGGGLLFSFDRTPWREVFEWIAQQGNLALHFKDLPPGSFTYRDQQAYDLDGAIDRLNLFLLAEGYMLVRGGRLLTVINMNDPRSLMQLDQIAETVTIDELDRWPANMMAKCFYDLGELDPEEAIDELAPLNLIRPPAVFRRTNQMLVIGTISQLRNVRRIIADFQPETLDNGTVVRAFDLQHATAEDILAVARPHLGLATGETIGIDVSISTDPSGKHIFVTGVEDKVQLIETLVEALDRPQSQLTTSTGSVVLRSHPVAGENLEMIYNVLLTLLAGQELRLSMDPQSNTIIALASPEIQQEIVETIEQLQQASAEFAVIPLKNLDPAFAVSLLEQMLDLPDPVFDDPDEVDPAAPKIDADTLNRRLYVRGRSTDVETIKRMVAELDTVESMANSDSTSSATIRLLPLTGRTARHMLEVAARFWKHPNPVILHPAANDLPMEMVAERTLHAPSHPAPSPRPSARLTSTAGAREIVLTSPHGADAEPIRCQWTPRGLLVQCEDAHALAAFEDHLRVVMGPLERVPNPPVVFYLKFVRADAAIPMLAELLNGSVSMENLTENSLVRGFASGSTMTSSFVSARDGMLTLIADTLTVVADTRLNRLIAQGTASDLDRLEQYLQIVDKDRGLTDVETYGRPHVVELQHTRAEVVAQTLQQAFADRVVRANATGEINAGNGGAARDAAGREKEDRGRDNKEGGQGASPRGSGRSVAPSLDLEPKMTIAVHAPSNSLIITAPDSLYEQALALIEEIDRRSEETIEVIGPQDASVLRSILNNGTAPGEAGRATERSRSSGNNGGSDRRGQADVFLRLQQRLRGG